MADSLRTMAVGGQGAASAQLLELPQDALISIFCKLDIESLVMVARSAKKLQQVVEDELVWMELCRQWESSVNLKSWRHQMYSGKSLYRLLCCLSKLVGVWSHRSEDPRGELVYVTWGICGLEGWQVVAGIGAFEEEVDFRKCFDVVGKPDGSHEFASVRSTDGSLDFIKLAAHIVFPSSQSPNEFVLTNHGGLDISSQEIAATNSFASSKPGSGPEIWQKVYKRLAIGDPTPGQELTGLWIGLYGAHGSEILTVSYSDNFVIGTKVIGDIDVPSGEITFKADTGTGSTNFPDLLDFPIPQLTKIYRGHGRIADETFLAPTWIRGLLLVEKRGDFYFVWQDDIFSIQYYGLDLEASFRSKTLVRQNRAATS